LRNYRTALFLPLLFLLAACAGNMAGTQPPDSYVEIENPAFTMSKDAPATIWVPRSHVEKGTPRGGELLIKGYEAVKQEVTGGAQQRVAGGASAQVASKAPQAATSPLAVKSRIAVLEVGQNALGQPFHDELKNASIGILLDTESVADHGAVSSPAERLSLAIRLYQNLNANLVFFIIAPDQIAPGKRLVAEIHDGMGGGMLREVGAVIPTYDAADQSAREKAVASAMTSVAEKVKEIAALVPWYGRIVAIDGEKVYINAGKETGVTVGQNFRVLRGGKFLTGLGFAPGKIVATMEIQGFVGPDGAYGVVKDGQGVGITDLVGIE
jgi:hypothetical protein